MNVLIFAAGLGTRLKPFTDEHPKALAPVAGVPALARNLQKISEIQTVVVEKVIINIHHFPQQIRDFVVSQEFGIPIEFSDESDLLLDTGGGLMKAAPQLADGLTDDTVMLINADILTDMPLDEIITYHKQAASDVTLLCADRESSRTLWFDATERLIGWENLKTGETKPSGFHVDPARDAQSPFCGVHVLQLSAVLPRLNEYGETIHPFPIIPFYLSEINRLKINRYLLPQTCHWFDIGSPSKLEAASAFFKG